ncbi:acyl-protein thioesterase 1 [Niveomyces insectorum RCEF 264]|uniref:Acyl-protein thioesterase 1 n=1 Tax=Niveomyces insectorum RCEF 264 TaxID=1081102 RepID=A0A167UJG6_9HYPO|nr:acyl-protein thioesterase 1 [Niveomyces insectorum RCEF 264]
MSRLAPLVFPAAGPRHTATVIFAHGLGDTGHGWAAAVENWRRRQRLDEVKFVLPHAPSIPITVNMGYRMPGWYDIAAIDGTVDSLRRNEDEAGILASRTYFQQLVQQEVDSGIPPDRIVLGGFSQGGALAIFAGITSPVRLAGVVAMSTYLLLSAKLEATYIPQPAAANVNAQLPILMCHGTADPVVPMQLGQLSRDTLRRLGYPVEWKEFAGMAHSACPEELDDVEAFLHKVLPPTAADGKQEL